LVGSNGAQRAEVGFAGMIRTVIVPEIPDAGIGDIGPDIDAGLKHIGVGTLIDGARPGRVDGAQNIVRGCLPSVPRRDRVIYERTIKVEILALDNLACGRGQVGIGEGVKGPRVGGLPARASASSMRQSYTVFDVNPE